MPAIALILAAAASTTAPGAVDTVHPKKPGQMQDASGHIVDLAGAGGS